MCRAIWPRRGRRPSVPLRACWNEVVAGGVAGDAAVDDAAQQRGTAETVGAVDATGELAAGEQAVEGLLVLVENLGLVVDLDAAHGEVEDGLHQRRRGSCR